MPDRFAGRIELYMKTDRGILLELYSRANAVRCIQQQRHTQRQIRLAAEKFYVLRLVVFQDAKVGLLQICHEFLPPIHYGQHHIHFRNYHSLDVAGRRLPGRGRLRCGWGTLLLLLLLLLRSLLRPRRYSRTGGCQHYNSDENSDSTAHMSPRCVSIIGTL